MASGQGTPGVMGKMGVSKRVRTHTHTFHILCGHLGLIKGSEGFPAHLLKIKQSAVMSYLISLRQGDEKHFSRKSRVGVIA